MNDHFTWLIWASAFMIPWVALFAALPRFRLPMLKASLWTSLLGLTQLLFVPSYWNPPSLFNLAQRYRLDIESLIFGFAFGGIGIVLYHAFTGARMRPMPVTERRLPLHRMHWFAILSPMVMFVVLDFLPWNTIYPGILAMAVGGIVTLLCRPDLKKKIWLGGAAFLLLYIVFLLGLIWTMPGYIERVWNLKALSGVIWYHMPLEELLFGFTFGMYWSGVYEHFTWSRSAGRHAGPGHEAPLSVAIHANKAQQHQH